MNSTQWKCKARAICRNPNWDHFGHEICPLADARQIHYCPEGKPAKMSWYKLGWGTLVSGKEWVLILLAGWRKKSNEAEGLREWQKKMKMSDDDNEAKVGLVVAVASSLVGKNWIFQDLLLSTFSRWRSIEKTNRYRLSGCGIFHRKIFGLQFDYKIFS